MADVVVAVVEVVVVVDATGDFVGKTVGVVYT